MRERKFKGKKTYNSEWVFGDLITNPNTNIQDAILEYTGKPRNIFEVIPETICEQTPFKIGEKFIFEGDIIGDWTETDEGKIQSKCEVFFHGVYGQWHIKLGESYSEPLYKELQDFQYEILGNIHEPKPEAK